MRTLRYSTIISPHILYNKKRHIRNTPLQELFRLNPHELQRDLIFLYFLQRKHPHNNFYGNCYRSKEHFMADMRKDWTFVNLKLSTEDAQKLKNFGEHFHNDTNAMVSEVLTRGYKVSVSWIDKQNAYVVSVSGTEASKFNKRSTMTSWSDDLEEAVTMMAFKVLEVTHEGDWSDYEQARSNWG